MLLQTITAFTVLAGWKESIQQSKNIKNPPKPHFWWTWPYTEQLMKSNLISNISSRSSFCFCSF